MSKVKNPVSSEDDSPMGRGSRYMAVLDAEINRRAKTQTLITQDRKRYADRLKVIDRQMYQSERRLDLQKRRHETRLEELKKIHTFHAGLKPVTMWGASSRRRALLTQARRDQKQIIQRNYDVIQPLCEGQLKVPVLTPIQKRIGDVSSMRSGLEEQDSLSEDKFNRLAPIQNFKMREGRGINSSSNKLARLRDRSPRKVTLDVKAMLPSDTSTPGPRALPPIGQSRLRESRSDVEDDDVFMDDHSTDRLSPIAAVTQENDAYSHHTELLVSMKSSHPVVKKNVLAPKPVLASRENTLGHLRKAPKPVNASAVVRKD